MYVCICRAVTERDITEAAQKGVRSFDQLSESMGIGADCGTCQHRACQMLSAIANESH